MWRRRNNRRGPATPSRPAPIGGMLAGMRDLNDLNFFAAIVANGGFSAASRALAIPKSRISRRVAALEAQLGVRLLERSTRRFSVTEVGQDVYRHARAALAEAEAIEEVAIRLKAEPQGLVRVSWPARGRPHPGAGAAGVSGAAPAALRCR